MAAAARVLLRTPGGLQDSKEAAGLSSAVLLRLEDAVVGDLRRAAETKQRLLFVAGKTPKLRVGSRTIDLTLTPDAFRNELYSSTAGSSAVDLTFRGLVGHRAVLASGHRGEAGIKGAAFGAADNDNTTGTDAALAALQNSMASYEQEKAAKQAKITNSVLYEPTSRFDAARKEKQDRRRNARLPGSAAGGAHGSRSQLAASAAARPTTAPALPVGGDDARLKAMRTPVVHFLAMRAATMEAISSATNVPAADLDTILQKTGKLVDGKWQLTDRAYKELDVWAFAYSTAEQRQSAVDNAIRAYDRQRLGKTERLWQMLLAPDDRDKGIVLSRLHLNGGAPPVPASKAGFTTPLHQTGSSAVIDAAVESSGGNAAKSASTPRHATSTADLKKRLLSKNPQKARAAEEAKERKRRERETAATDERENTKVAPPSPNTTAARKPGTTAAPKGKVGAASAFKSDALVHSSADESDGGDEGEVHEVPSASHRITTSTKKDPSPVKSAKSTAVAAKHRPSSSSDSSDVPLQQSAKRAPATTAASSKLKARPSAAVPGDKPAAQVNGVSKAVAGKATTAGKTTPRPDQKPAGKVSVSSPQLQAQRKGNPSTPHRIGDATLARSPGVARPRNTSDVSMSDRSATGVQKVRQSAGLGASGHNGGDTPRGADPASSAAATARKRQDTVTSSGGETAPPAAKPKARPNGNTAADTLAPSVRTASNPAQVKPTPTGAAINGVKRKADAADSAGPAAKQRKAERSPSSSQAPATTDGHTRPAALFKTTRPAHASPLSSSSASSSVAVQQTKKPDPRPGPLSKPQQPSPSMPSLDNGPDLPSTNTSATTSKDNLWSTATTATRGTAATSLAGDADDPPDPALASLTFAQGVQQARDFRDRYYPRYAALHAELAALEARGLQPPRADADRLWLWHKRLENMKREIYMAAAREGE